MTSDDLERRVRRIESQLDETNGLPAEVRAAREEAATAREDAAAARHLAAANDRDVAAIHSDLLDFKRATAHSFNAMRADLTDLRSEVNARFAKVDENVAKVAVGQQQIVTMLTTLIDRDDP